MRELDFTDKIKKALAEQQGSEEAITEEAWAEDEFERGFVDVRPQMQQENVQLFIFGFGDAKLEDLTKWESFSAQRRACQEEAPERTYPSEGDIFPLLISINTAMNQVTCGESKALITDLMNSSSFNIIKFDFI